jgi:hypothetical protein
MIFTNGKDIPLNANSGTLPDVSGAMLDYFQAMAFGVVNTTVENFQAVQVKTTVNFQGVWQPLNERQLMLKPEGQRAWSWFWLHAEPSLILQVDSVITYLGVQYRVMTHKNYQLYGYVEYHLVQDYTGAGPEASP